MVRSTASLKKLNGKWSPIDPGFKIWVRIEIRLKNSSFEIRLCRVLNLRADKYRKTLIIKSSIISKVKLNENLKHWWEIYSSCSRIDKYVVPWARVFQSHSSFMSINEIFSKIHIGRISLLDFHLASRKVTWNLQISLHNHNSCI